MPNPNKTNDPQITLTGYLKQGSQGELMTFTLRLGMFELACIVNIPAEGETKAPVYCKFKVRHPDDLPNRRNKEDSEYDYGDSNQQ